MFWDQVAGIYDIFVNVINRKTHQELRKIIAGLIEEGDDVLECACGTGLLTAVIAPRCSHITATDFSRKMLEKAKVNCKAYDNITYAEADIMGLDYPDDSFDKVVAGNVIHLLDKPMTALKELERVCKDGGTLIIPTYMNQDKEGRTNSLSSAIGKAGADFKREFTIETYRQFFIEAGHDDVRIIQAQGRIPCAVAVMRKAAK